MQLIVSDAFKAAFKRLSKDKQKVVSQAVTKLGADVIVPSLKVRRLRGSEGFWLANVGRTGYRIVFSQPEEGTAELLDVCEHDTTYRKWNRR